MIAVSHAAVSSENGICSQIGVDILKKGGSSVDSSIATALCIGTINFYSSGIGGYFILTPMTLGFHLSIRKEAVLC